MTVTYHYRDSNAVIAPKFALRMQGPWLKVVVTHPKIALDEAQKQSAPSATERVTALIDTGASRSIITDALAQKLKLKHTGNTRKVVSVQDQQDRPEYFAAIRFPWGATEEVAVVACPLKGYDCLIGRDILMNWTMTYNGREGSITISDE